MWEYASIYILCAIASFILGYTCRDITKRKQKGKPKFSETYMYRYIRDCNKDFVLYCIDKEILRDYWDRRDLIDLRVSIEEQIEEQLEKEKKMETRKKVLYQELSKSGRMLRSVGYIESSVKGKSGKIYHEIHPDSGDDFERHCIVWVCEDDVCAVLSDTKNCECCCHKKKNK